MLDFDPITVISTIINLLVIFLLLRWLLLKPVNQFLEQRRQQIHDDLDGAKKDREEAQKLLEKHQRMLDQGKGEAAKIVEEAMRQAELRREEMLAKAQEEAAQVLERAKAEIAQEQAKAIGQLRTEISTLSVAVAEKMLAHSVTPDDQDNIFNQVLEEMEEDYAKYGS